MAEKIQESIMPGGEKMRKRMGMRKWRRSYERDGDEDLKNEDG